ncbi:GTP cyclohydrolase 1 [Vitis vinifera]|uniref:GTP cyclohydrolase 1 n=1 Tax=Vitis vinifera TaxID=29760 RepID=A0A438HI60_VITVI|nr:GTP cyclohydrolase 1 [Vitis vinifera]
MGVLDEGHVEVGFEQETLAIEEAVKVLLQGLGEDINREGLSKTPARVAKALREGTRDYELTVATIVQWIEEEGNSATLKLALRGVFDIENISKPFKQAEHSGLNQKVRVELDLSIGRQKAKDIVQGALFPEAGLNNGIGHAGGVGGLVIVRDLDLFSYCESCLLPFQVKCHVGYVPSGQCVVGLSKLSRVADVFAKRLQDPQRLADDVCSALNHGIKPAGVAVVLQCLHIHFPNLELGLLDSTHQEWVKVSVCSGKGLFENAKATIWSDFLSLLKFRGINVEKTCTRDSTGPCWCPSQSSSALIPCKIETVHQMVTAVTSILRSLGEDPLRKGLVGTPNRYVRWLLNFEKTNMELKLDGYVCGKMDPFQPNCNEEEMHSELNLAFWSQCEHHLLPFHGVVQERITRQVAETVSSLLGGDVIVVVEASHSCMVSRGIEKLGSNTATMALLGRFSTDDTAKTMFLQRIQNTSTS